MRSTVAATDALLPSVSLGRRGGAGDRTPAFPCSFLEVDSTIVGTVSPSETPSTSAPTPGAKAAAALISFSYSGRSAGEGYRGV